jgi:hypothetical protein
LRFPILLNEIEIHFHFRGCPMLPLRALFILALILHATFICAQGSGNSGASIPSPIQDNSFLIEEAYNQEEGVVQHIGSFERLTNSHDWVYTQTDEWPLRSIKHQLSVTLAGTHAGSFAGSGRGGVTRLSITGIN